MRLKNICGSELSFSTLGFTAPAGEFDAPQHLVERLLRNDAIQKVEAAPNEQAVVKRVKLKEKY